MKSSKGRKVQETTINSGYERRIFEGLKPEEIMQIHINEFIGTLTKIRNPYYGNFIAKAILDYLKKPKSYPNAIAELRAYLEKTEELETNRTVALHQRIFTDILRDCACRNPASKGKKK